MKIALEGSRLQLRSCSNTMELKNWGWPHRKVSKAFYLFHFIPQPGTALQKRNPLKNPLPPWGKRREGGHQQPLASPGTPLMRCLMLSPANRAAPSSCLCTPWSRSPTTTHTHAARMPTLTPSIQHSTASPSQSN